MQRGQLAGKGFGGGHADFRAGVGVDRAAASRVIIEPTTLQMARVLASLCAWLRAAAARVSAVSPDWLMAIDQTFLIDDGIAIAEFAAVVHFDVKARQALDHEFAGQSGVPAGSAGDDFTPVEIRGTACSEMCISSRKTFPVSWRNAAEQSVAHGARLLENFLLHEMLVAALFGHDRVPGDVLGGAIDGAAFVIHDANAVLA